MPRGRNPIVRNAVERVFEIYSNYSNDRILEIAITEAQRYSSNSSAITPTLINNMYYDWSNGQRLYAPRSYRRQQQRDTQRQSNNQSNSRGRPRLSKIRPNKTFGIEIEFINSTFDVFTIARTLTENGIATNYESYNHRHSNQWKLTTDASVVGGLELVSPVLKGESGIEQINKVCKVMERLGCKINKSCGLHVHHKVVKSRAKSTMRNALRLYADHQSQFSAMLPPSRTNNRYCQEINQLRHNFSDDNELTQFAFNSYNRYHAVNPLAFWRHGTLEFRQHSGTIEAKKIINWVLITQKIVERAEKMNQYDGDSTRSIAEEFKLDNNLNDYIVERTNKFSSIANRRAA